MHRILHITPSLTGSASARQMRLLIAGLSRDEWQIDVMTLDGKVSVDLAQVDHHSVLRRRSIDPTAWRQLRDEIKRLRPDLVHIWSRYAECFIRTAALAAKVPQVITSVRHVMLGQSFPWTSIDRRLAKRSQIVANCPIVRDACRKVGVPNDRLMVIPDGVSLVEETGLSPTIRAERRSQWLGAHGHPAETRVIAFVGRLETRQQLKKLLWTTDQLNIVHKEVVLLLIGDGPQRNVLERYARLYHIDKKIHFLGSRDDVPQLVPLAEVLIAPASGAALSSAILEAMAAGVPVVASDIPAHREIIVSSVNGILVDIQHRAALGGAIHRLWDDPQLSASIANRARQMVAEKFPPAAMVAGYEQLYARLLESKPNGRT